MIYNIPTTDMGLSKSYLTLWNGFFNLTDKELETMAKILDLYRQLETDGVKEPYLYDILFNTTNRKAIYNALEITQFNFSKILKNLQEKRMLIPCGKTYTIPSMAMPTNKLEINFYGD